MRTEYEFVLPRGYVDETGRVHQRGIMRLATARDELEPLRDPLVAGPDDPRLTIIVLSRVVQSLGALTLVTRSHIEGLFAADLAYLQDFYGVINFGTEEDIDALLAVQEQERASAAPAPAAQGAGNLPAQEVRSGGDATENAPPPAQAQRPVSRRSAIEETPRAPSRRSAVEEVRSSSR